MADNETILSTALHALRFQADSFYTPDGPQRLVDMLHEALAAVRALRDEDGTLPREAHEIAYALQKPARADMSGDMFRCALEFWINIGPLGWALAVRNLRANIIPFRQMRGILETQPQNRQLLLVNQLAMGREEGSGFCEWCAATLAPDKDWTSSECLLFLRALDDARLTATPQVRLALVRRGVADTLQRELEHLARHPAPGNLLPALHALGRPVPLRLFVPLFEWALSAGPRLASACIRLARIPGTSPRVAKPLSGLLGHADRDVRIEALRTLFLLPAPSQEKILAMALRTHPQDRAATLPLALAMAAPSFTRFLSALPAKHQAAIALQLFATLCKTAPEFTAQALEITLRAVPKDSQDNAVKGAREYIRREHSGRKLTTEPPTPAFAEQPAADAPAMRKGLLARFKGKSPLEKGQERLKAALDNPVGTDDLDIQGLEAMDLAMDSRTFGNTQAKKAKFFRLQARKCVFNNANFENAQMLDTVFLHCRFDGCDFTGAGFKECRFAHCTFKNCRFDQTFLFKTSFESCALDQCTLVRAVLDWCTLTLCSLAETNAWGMHLDNTTVRATGFACANLTKAVLFGCTLSGIVFQHTTLQRMTLEQCRVVSPRFDASPPARCRFHACRTDAAPLLKAQLKQMFEALAGPEAAPPLAWARTALGAKMALAVARRWYLARDIRSREAAMLANNVRRMDMATRTMGPGREDFVHMLPHLLQTDVFERQLGNGEAQDYPLCRVSGYAPDNDLPDRMREHFASFGLQEPPADGVRIEAVYTIGSVGSIAMTRESDLDFWVCVHPEDAKPEVLDGLRRKLERISLWGQERFDLETTFFVMDLADVQRNHFGFSDKESSGTAQALLLKEEFYRTALKLCGGNLAWWLAPPGASRKAYDQVAAMAAQGACGLGDRVVDMGHMGRIPPGEFFGASLWQLVKAFKSPFKSILKFGLLERYVSGGDTALLCEDIKKDVARGEPGLFAVDPYAVLFKRVHDHYKATGNAKAEHLITLAFLLKLGDEVMVEKPLDPHATARWVLVNSFFEELGPSGDKVAQAIRQHGFRQLLALGQEVSMFMVQTYTSVQQRLSAENQETRLDPTDLTRMGRRIFAIFAKQPNKIEHIPFVNPIKGGFQSLRFTAERAPGRPPVWVVHGLPPKAMSRAENYEEIRRGKDLARMLAWVGGNGLLGTRTMVEADRSMTPISAEDLNRLVPALAHFFHQQKVFDVDLGETLREERITSAFFILNLMADRQDSILRHVSVIYATNWGELFCATKGLKDQSLLHSPKAVLAEITGKKVGNMTFDQFQPHRSKCPRIVTL